LLLILLIVALIVAAQLLWQYFLPSRLVAALDHKRHLPPNTNTLPLKNNMIALPWEIDNFVIKRDIFGGFSSILKNVKNNMIALP
jgi:hypothetical protein